MIITIIFVFDPLAVLLLIASSTHSWRYIDAGGKITPSANPPISKQSSAQSKNPSGGQSLKKIVEKQKEVTSKPTSLSQDIHANPLVFKDLEKTLRRINGGF